VYQNLDRPPLRARALRSALGPDGWDVRVVEATGSTNADISAAARRGAAEGLVIVAEEQRAGRGRLGRLWVSPPRSALTFSILLRPPAPSSWLPLLAGVTVVAALRECAGVQATLKWPNDVQVAGRKLGGLLGEVAGSAVVLGVGLNVSLRQAELPRADATSLVLEQADVTDRDTLLKAILRSFARGYAGWLSEPDALPPAYRSVCGTLGREVRIELPGGAVATGVATDVDVSGGLVVNGVTYGAGDVVHLR
jgi:BirA family biotin operon repressor/biotin-[acetyl-CoA-carboxylase] ligase